MKWEKRKKQGVFERGGGGSAQIEIPLPKRGKREKGSGDKRGKKEGGKGTFLFHF